MLKDISEDKFWGFVLIALGILSLTLRPFDKVDAVLKGTADSALTAILFGLSAVVVVLALRGTPSLKALAIFWVVTP